MRLRCRSLQRLARYKTGLRDRSGAPQIVGGEMFLRRGVVAMRLRCRNRVAIDSELRLGLGLFRLLFVQSQLERRRIDRREQITLFHRLVVDDAYADNPAADVRRDVDEVGGDIGVVGVRASIDNAIIVSCSAISGPF